MRSNNKQLPSIDPQDQKAFLRHSYNGHRSPQKKISPWSTKCMIKSLFTEEKKSQGEKSKDNNNNTCFDYKSEKNSSQVNISATMARGRHAEEFETGSQNRSKTGIDCCY